MARAIKRFIDVEIRKDTPRVSAVGFGIPLVLTNNVLLSIARRHRRFTTAASVQSFFGSASEEYKTADAYFYQAPFNVNQPEEIQFGRFVSEDSKALLEGGSSPLTDLDTWKAVADGEFKITIDSTVQNVSGLDFSSVTSLDDVASVIQAGLDGEDNLATCYFLINRFNFQSKTTGATSTITLLETVDTPVGTDISGTGFLDADTAYSVLNPGGAYLSQGQVLETVDTALAAIEDVNSDWYTLCIIKIFRDTNTIQDIADYIESKRKMFLSATNDANVLVLGSTATNCHYVKNANYKRTGFIYHNDSGLYPDLSWIGQQLPKAMGSTNWAYKTLAGIAEGALVDIPALDLSEAQKDAALDVNCNVYTTTLGASFTYFGTMGGGKNVDKEGEYIDIVRNIDFLQSRVEEGLLSLLLERDIVPFTNAGINMVDTRLQSLLTEYGVIQGILIEGTIQTSFPKRSEVSSIDRDDRKLPDGIFTAELQGGINTVIVRGTVYV